MSSSLSRRGFLSRSVSVGAAALVPRSGFGGQGSRAASARTTLAAIGTGGQGLQNLATLLDFPEIQVVAVCDVNRESGGYLSWNWQEGKDQRNAGREPARRLVEEHYGRQGKSGTYQWLPGLRRFPRTAGQGRRRCRHDCHPGSCPRRGDHGRSEKGQTRLLREAVDLLGRGSPAMTEAARAGPAWPPNWATRARPRRRPAWSAN